MSIEIDWDTLRYLPQEPNPELLAQARDAASIVGYDWDNESRLHARVLAVRALTPGSQLRWYDDYLPEPPPRVYRIDYVSWAVPDEFSLDLLDQVVARVESLCIDEVTLAKGDTITYGLGREMNFQSWSDNELPQSLADGPLPQEAMEELVCVLANQWVDELLEHTEGDPACVAHWPSPLREEAEQLIAKHREEYGYGEGDG